MSALRRVPWHGAEERSAICWCALASGEFLRLEDGLSRKGEGEGAERSEGCGEYVHGCRCLWYVVDCYVRDCLDVGQSKQEVTRDELHLRKERPCLFTATPSL